METDEARWIKTLPRVSSSQNERDWESLLPAPIEHQPLASREDFSADPGQAPNGASLERVHPRVVQAQVEARPSPPHFSQAALDLAQVFVAVVDDAQTDAFRALIAV